jgi:hypothetical protein
MRSLAGDKFLINTVLKHGVKYGKTLENCFNSFRPMTPKGETVKTVSLARDRFGHPAKAGC